MVYKNASVNGIHCVQINKEDFADFVERAKRLKGKADELYPEWNFNKLKGYRYNSPDNIASRAYGYCPMNADEETKDNYIIAAYMDAASADHWYTYEKEWE